MTAALEGGEWSAARSGRTLLPGKTQYPLYRRLGGPQGRSGRAENLAPPGFDPSDRPARSQSLYRLSYPAHQTHITYARFCQSRFYSWYKYICWNYEQINHQQDTNYVFLGHYVLFALNLPIPSKQAMSVICQAFVSQVWRWGFQDRSFSFSDIKSQKCSEPSKTNAYKINVIWKVKVKINLSVCMLWRYTGSVEVWLHSFYNVGTRYSHTYAFTKLYRYGGEPNICI